MSRKERDLIFVVLLKVTKFIYRSLGRPCCTASIPCNNHMPLGWCDLLFVCLHALLLLRSQLVNKLGRRVQPKASLLSLREFLPPHRLKYGFCTIALSLSLYVYRLGLIAYIRTYAQRESCVSTQKSIAKIAGDRESNVTQSVESCRAKCVSLSLDSISTISV